MLPNRIRRAFRLDVRGGETTTAETDEEIRAHFEFRIEALVARGHSRAEAEEEAAKRFGPLREGRTQMLEAARNREERIVMREYVDQLATDAKYALGQLRRAPALTAGVVFTFALGIGANATMFSVIDRLLLHPPAHVANPEQVKVVRSQIQFGNKLVPNAGFSYPVFSDLRDQMRGVSSVAMQTFPNELPIGRGAGARQIRTVLISGNYFSTLGVQPVLGRFMNVDDAAPPTGHPVAVISYGLWQREFGGAPEVLGKTLDFGKTQLTIIGVAPRDFNGVGFRPIDAWLPVTTNPTLGALSFLGKEWSTSRSATWVSVFVRLAPNANVTAVAAQAQQVFRAGVASTGKVDSTTRIELESILPLQKSALSQEAKVASLLAVVAALVLLIACANVANLLLARALRRRREIAVRLALGIPRNRLIRQLLTESMLLALLGGVAALVVATLGTSLMRQVLLANYTWPGSPIDGRLLLFTGITAAVVGVASGLIPALHSHSLNVTSALRESAQGVGVQRARVRTMLLVTQGVLSAVLLIGTGLFLRSLQNVSRVDLGIDTNRVVRVTINFSGSGLSDDAVKDAFRRLEENARLLPGVAFATLGEGVSFGWSLGTRMIVPGIDSLPIPNGTGPNLIGVSNDYFRTMGTRILSGRPISESDIRSGSRVAVVSEEMAHRVWPGRSAIGECIKLEADSLPCNDIIGIAANVHQSELEEDAPYSTVYVPLVHGRNFLRARTLLIRAKNTDAAPLLNSVRKMLHETVPDLPYPTVDVMHTMLDKEIQPWRLGATMFGAFGVIALLLTAVGLYSMVTYTVNARLRELGIRMALGAQPAGIFRLILTYGVSTVAISASVGIVIALFAGPFVSPLLFHSSPRDPLVFGTVLAVLIGVAIVASVVPARRATRADALSVLKAE